MPDRATIKQPTESSSRAVPTARDFSFPYIPSARFPFLHSPGLQPFHFRKLRLKNDTCPKPQAYEISAPPSPKLASDPVPSAWSSAPEKTFIKIRQRMIDVIPTFFAR
jgi:hypothetical protein